MKTKRTTLIVRPGSWIVPKTLGLIENHTINIHLKPRALQRLGGPIYELLLFAAIGSRESLMMVRDAAIKLFEERNDKVNLFRVLVMLDDICPGCIDWEGIVFRSRLIRPGTQIVLRRREIGEALEVDFMWRNFGMPRIIDFEIRNDRRTPIEFFGGLRSQIQ